MRDFWRCGKLAMDEMKFLAYRCGFIEQGLTVHHIYGELRHMEGLCLKIPSHVVNMLSAMVSDYIYIYTNYRFVYFAVYDIFSFW